MKILITGSSGLVGRNLTDSLKKDYDLLTPSHSELDLMKYSDVRNYIGIKNPDIIIHCAGRVGGIQANINNPVNFFIENLDMGRNIVFAARENNVIKLINLGSSCMYPRNAINPLKEEFILDGELEPTNEGYALAKIATQRLCSYIKVENPEYDYKTLIPCNLYGAYDNFHPVRSHMIPAVIRKIDDAFSNNNSEVEIWGDGEARREFMHIDDLVDGIRFILDNYEKVPSVMNIGTGKDYTVNEYYQVVSDVIGFKGEFVHDLSKPVGMKQKLVDVSLARDTGWTSTLSLVEGIKRTYSYYLNEIKGK